MGSDPILRALRWISDDDRERRVYSRYPAGSSKGGQFAPKTGGAGVMGGTGHTSSKRYAHGRGTKSDPFTTNSPAAAARALGQGKHVQLHSEEEVSLFLNEVQALAKSNPRKTYDLCKVSVPDTNLFCAEHKGVPRVRMPQLKATTDRVRPGSPADEMLKDGRLTANAKGEVDIGPMFVESLQARGISVTPARVDAGLLKPSQSQIDGGKVTGIAGAMRAGKVPEEAIFTTSDHYIVDGHHRAVAVIANEFITGQALTIPVNQIDSDIITTLRDANDFAIGMGIPGAGVAVGRSTRLGCRDGACEMRER